MNVLFAYDRSQYCEYAMNSLRQLPCVAEIDLSLVTVIPFLPIADWTTSVYVNDPSPLLQAERAANEQALQQLATLIEGDFRSVRTQILTGSPGLEIVKLAASKNSELVVTGAIGVSAISRVLLGSVSDYVTMRAGCSALVIRPDANSPTPAIPEAVLPRRVLVGIGNAKSDERLTDWIARLQLPPETEIELVHVMETRPDYEINVLRTASRYMKEVRSTAAMQIDAVSSKLEERGHRVKSALIDEIHIGKALVDHAVKHHCDLVITGDQRETYAERVLLGSTARHVLRNSPCSVLVARSC